MMREQQVLDFERIGSLAEENASLTVRPPALLPVVMPERGTWTPLHMFGGCSRAPEAQPGIWGSITPHQPLLPAGGTIPRS